MLHHGSYSWNTFSCYCSLSAHLFVTKLKRNRLWKRISLLSSRPHETCRAPRCASKHWDEKPILFARGSIERPLQGTLRQLRHVSASTATRTQVFFRNHSQSGAGPDNDNRFLRVHNFNLIPLWSFRDLRRGCTPHITSQPTTNTAHIFQWLQRQLKSSTFR